MILHKKKVRLIFRFFSGGVLLAGFACSNPDDAEDPLAVWKEQPEQQIVFISKADAAEGELYLLKKDGLITRLTSNSRYEYAAALSPDRRKVAFFAGNAADMLTWEIFVMDLDSLTETRLTNNSVIDAHPDWSPDGNRIVFSSFSDSLGNPVGAADILVMNADGTGMKRLTNSPAIEDNDPEWSPDGSRIVFKSTRYTNQSAREEICMMDSNGTNMTRLTQTTGWQSDHDPSWAPGGTAIVFIRYEGTRAWTDGTDPAVLVDHWQELVPWNVHEVNLVGTTVKLTNDTDCGWGVAIYSSSGSKILFGKTDWIINGSNQLIGGHHRLFMMNSNSTEQQQLIPDDRHTPTLEYFDW